MIDIAIDYIEAGFYEEAITLIRTHHDNTVPECIVPNPLQKSVSTHFLLAWALEQAGDISGSQKVLSEVEKASPDYFFPSRTYEQLVLEWAISKCENPTLAAFGLGNYYFDLKLHALAIKVWEKAVDKGCSYSTLYRNLGIAYWNAESDGEKAVTIYQKAVELAPDDIRVLSMSMISCRKNEIMLLSIV